MALVGNIPVIPTPFVDGKVEYAGFNRMFEKTADYVEGYVVCGSTGEAPALTTKERIEVLRYTAKQCAGKKEVVAGLGHTSLADAAEIGLAAAETGIRTALVPSPYYFPNSLDMVIDYFGKLALQTGMDIVFYDNPTTTKTHFTGEQLIAIAAAVPNIKAIKMTDHSMGKIRHLKQHTKLKVFGGDDIICFRAFEAGVDGNMIIAPIIYPAAFKACWQAYQKGDRTESFQIFSEGILPFIHLFGPGDEVATTKALYHHLNIFSSAETRTPLIPSDSQRIEEVLLGYQQGLAVERKYSQGV